MENAYIRQILGALSAHEAVHAADKDEVDKDIRYDLDHPLDSYGRPDKEIKAYETEDRVIGQYKEQYYGNKHDNTARDPWFIPGN